MNKRILILYTSVGLGHKTIAENIGYHLEQAGHTVKLFDVYELQDGLLVQVGKALHSFINRRVPFVWKWLYTSKWFTDATLSSRVKVAGFNYQNVKIVVDEFHPDVIIPTQTSGSAIVEFMKQQGMYHGKFVIAFSDYHLHRHWLYPSADLYLANIEEQKTEMIRLGIPTEKIVVCGITLRPQRLSLDYKNVRKNLELNDNDKVVLVGSGSLGFGGLSEVVIKRLSELLPPAVKLFVMTGKNKDLYEKLKKNLSKDNKNIRIFSYYSPMDELYALSSMILSKPGGLTVAETLQWNIPMLVTHWLPGQEEINYHYLIRNKLVIEQPAVVNAETLAQHIIAELESGSAREALSRSVIRAHITQSKNEGKMVQKAIETLFHKV